MITITEKELEIVKCLAKGMGIKQIAKALYNKPCTIQRQIFGIYNKIAAFGYKRTMHQLAVLYVATPELFSVVKRNFDTRNTKRCMAIKMLKQRIHYKSVADRLGMNSESVSTYKGQISVKEFHTLPYIHKL